MEVAEHIDFSKNDEIASSMIRNMRKDAVLIWTAAVPGQGGDGHINCQTRDYWLEKLKSVGLINDIEVQNELLEFVKTNGGYMGWFVNNLIFMRKS